MGEMGNSYLLEATVTNHTNTFYLCIDLKSFYASVECVERGLDPMTTLLAVADPERTDKTICLAITPAMKDLVTNFPVIPNLNGGPLPSTQDPFSSPNCKPPLLQIGRASCRERV